MKFFLFTLALVPSLALADSRPYLVKQLDAKTAYCTEAGHRNRTAYLPKSVAVRENAGGVDVALEVAFLECRKAGEAYVWAPRNPKAPIHRTSLGGEPIVTTVRDQEFVLVTQASRLLASQALTDATLQEARFGFATGLALTAAQREELARGLDVKVRVEFFTRGIVTDSYQGQDFVVGMRAGGVYTLGFTLRRAGEGSIDVIEAGLVR